MSRTVVIIVNWNTRRALAACLQNLGGEAEAVPLDVVVVDNASKDGSADMTASDFPGVELIRNSANLGFARAVNIPLGRLKNRPDVEFVLLLNPDTIFPRGTIRRLVDHLAAHPQAAACAPALRLPDGRFQTGAGGFLPSFLTALTYFFFISRFCPGCRALFLNQAALAGRPDSVPVEWLSGACFLVRRKAADEVGFLDERYFLYAEDIDWGARMKKKGWRLDYLPRLTVVHCHGLSMREHSPLSDPRWLEGLFAFTRASRGGAEASAVRICAALGFLLRAGGYGGAALICPKNSALYLKRATDMVRFYRKCLLA